MLNAKSSRLLLSIVLIGISSSPVHAQLSRLFHIDSLAPGSIEFTSATYSLGGSCARAGDVDGDGLDDLLIGSSAGSQHVPWQAILIYGQELPPGKLDPHAGRFRKTIMDTPPADMEFSGAVDVNGDGVDDFAIDLFPYIAVVFGSKVLPERFDMAELGKSIPGVKILRAQGTNALDQVTLGRDINGDGLGEILVGDYQFDKNTDDWGKGRAFVIFGSASFPEMVSLESEKLTE